jgi:DNA-binding IclR family transcriptional regulator
MTQARRASPKAFNDDYSGPKHGRTGSSLMGASRYWAKVPSTVVKSAGRALQILEYFDDTRSAANMMDVARTLNYPESSTSVLLRSLTTLGYLHYDRHKRTYRPTSRVRLLGSWIDSPLFQNDGVIHLMEDLNSEVEDTVMLAARNELSTQYIHVVQARTALRLHLTPGTMRPIAKSIPGWVMLSRLSDIEIAKLVRRVNAETPSGEELVNIGELLQRMAEIRRDGYISSTSLVTPGCTVLAMPLPPQLSETQLVIAIGGPTPRIEGRVETLVELLNQRIRDHLGG